ncbi:MAG: hypothetical protein OXF02_05625 [Simkaniaceae bacterium]|nr:hypothetical protein [Simkaniaceae bacterium]
MAGVAPTPPEQSIDDADPSPPPMDRERRKAHVLEMDELLAESDVTRAMLSIKQSDSEADPASSTPVASSPPDCGREVADAQPCISE